MKQIVVNKAPDRNGLAILPVAYGLLIAAYVAVRYGYRWAETDTATFVDAIRNVASQGTITPTGGAYQHGYGYQAIVTSFSSISGLSIPTVQLMVFPFLLSVTALMAFIAFRALTSSAVLGSISALLLLIQPEFVFSSLRGSHEKVTFILVLMLVFLLTASLTRRSSLQVMAAFIVAFYVAAWALITSNSFFGSSFLASLALALVGGFVALRLMGASIVELQATRRLMYATLSCFILLVIFIEYVYTPVQSNFALLRTMVEQLALLFLSASLEGNPYGTVTSGAAWVTPWMYPLLTMFNWLIVLGAAVSWVWLALLFRTDPGMRNRRNLLVLWLFGAAFALQVVLATAVDLAGFLGDNLQIRLFPLFMIFAIALVVVGGAQLAVRLQHPTLRRAAAAMAVGCVALFAATGLLKATNDPLVSNKWLFFTASEQRALAWVDSELKGREVWTEFDERLRVMQIIHQPADPEQANRYVVGSPQESARYVVLSDVTKRRSLRLKLPLPNVMHEDILFDNGDTQVFHRVPQTPYQP